MTEATLRAVERAVIKKITKKNNTSRNGISRGTREMEATVLSDGRIGCHAHGAIGRIGVGPDLDRRHEQRLDRRLELVGWSGADRWAVRPSSIRRQTSSLA
jgi:hypothetical protein